MVLINKAINEVTLKLVYYGPGLCGKTTNLEQIYKNPKLDNKGKMISMATETDRTLFFDFMPMELGTIGGQKIRVQLYTVPGQVFYDATRKLVLRGADGVVFVADSQPSMRESNLESLENLRTNLRLNRIDPDKIAVVYQYNKRDLPAVASVEEMNEYMKPGRIPVVEAAAIQGTGVTQTLRQAVAKILDNIKQNVDTTLYDAPPLARPAMKAPSGATTGSAGTPKVSIAALAAERAGTRPAAAAKPSAPAPVPTPQAPPPVAAAPQAPAPPPVKEPLFSAPFIAADDDEPEAVQFGEADPFAEDAPQEAVQADFAAVEDFSPFEGVAEPLAMEDVTGFAMAEPATELGDEAYVSMPEPELSLEPESPADFGDAFAGAQSVAAVGSPVDLTSAVQAADLLVRQLEEALQTARGHRDELQRQLNQQ